MKSFAPSLTRIGFLVAVGATIVAFLFFVLDQVGCNRTDSLGELAAYRDTVMYFKGKYVKDSIAYNEAVRTGRREFEAVVLSKDIELRDLYRELRRVTGAVVVRSDIRIDTLKVPLLVDSGCDSCVAVFDADSADYRIAGIISSKSIQFSIISFPDTLRMVHGTKRNGLFAATKYVVAATHSNPYVSIQGLQSFEIREKLPFYRKWWFIFGSGVFAGAILNSK